ncbi:MAG: DUF4350 domain-containing protein [Gammaproteobacteria bacterium]
MTRLQTLLLVLVLAIAASMAYWWMNNLERVTESTYVGYSGEARTNPLLAARRLARKMGIPAESVGEVSQLNELPPVSDTLVLASHRNTFSDKRSRDLLNWVKDGGRLLVAARHERPDDEDMPVEDPLLQELGVDAFVHRTEISREDEDGEPPITEFTLPGTPRPLGAHLATRFGLEATSASPAFTVHDDTGVKLISVEHGAGRATVLTELHFVENRNIGEHDHAEILWHLLNLDGPATKIWLIHADAMPSLWQLLWTKAPLIIGVVAVMLVAWLAAATRRFGPIVHMPSPDRRRILEHIEASGHFLWSKGKQKTLLRSVHEGLERELRLAHPVWSTYTTRKREQLLAQIADLTREEVQALLYNPPATTPQEFTRSVQILETIRKKL